MLWNNNANMLSEENEGIVPIYCALPLGYTMVAAVSQGAMESTEECEAWHMHDKMGDTRPCETHCPKTSNKDSKLV